MICHGILNIQETKYGVEPNEIILSTGKRRGFEATCVVHEATKDFIYSCSRILYCYEPNTKIA